MLKVHIRRTLFAAIIAGLFGFFIAWRSPKLYEAVVEVMAGSPQISSDPTMPQELKKVLLSGTVNDLDSDTGMIRSQRIFDDALKASSKEMNGTSSTGEDLASGKSFQELYPMFDLDIPASLNQYAPEQMRVVKIRVRAYGPKDAASIANNVATSFANYRKDRSKKAVRGALDMVTAQSKKAKQKLDSIDNQFRTLKLDHHIVDVQAGNVSMTEKLARLRERRSLTESELEGARAELATTKASILKIPRYMLGSSNNDMDPQVNAYRTLMLQAENDLANERQRYSDEAPSVQRALEKYNDLKIKFEKEEKKGKTVKSGQLTVPNPVYSELEGRVATAQVKVSSLRETLAPINAQIIAAETEAATYPVMESKIFDLSRNRLVYEEQYQKNQKWVEELQNVSEGQTSQIQNLADPERISDPVAPDTKKYVILAAIVGSLIGLAYSFAMESFKLPVHTSWQLAELTALPVAASIPMMPKPLARRHYSEIRNSDFKPIESFRYMAFSMMAKENRPGVVLFTAVGEDVDSTGAAAEFAVAMAKTGSRVSLVDCDLRLPRLSELFGVEGRSGVAEILGRTILPGESTDLFVATEHENLMILPAGAASASGLSDFNSSHMSGLIEDLRGKADMVVINCPPVDVFADASRLAQYVDEVCMVISAKTTSYRAIPVAQEILHKSGAKDMSIVLTNGSPTEEPFGTRTGASVARR